MPSLVEKMALTIGNADRRERGLPSLNKLEDFSGLVISKSRLVVMAEAAIALMDNHVSRAAQIIGRRGGEEYARRIKDGTASPRPPRNQKKPTPCRRCTQMLPSAREAYSHCTGKSREEVARRRAEALSMGGK